jgi:hypothetical protein
MITLGIIGTAGRKEDRFKLNRANYSEALKAGKKVMEQVKADALVSGGAAYIDHIAVRLFLRGFVKSFTLHLPCKWDKKACEFKDSGVVDYRTNPGGTANHYHRKFSATVGINSLLDIQNAIDAGAKVVVTEGSWSEIQRSPKRLILSSP